MACTTLAASRRARRSRAEGARLGRPPRPGVPRGWRCGQPRRGGRRRSGPCRSLMSAGARGVGGGRRGWRGAGLQLTVLHCSPTNRRSLRPLRCSLWRDCTPISRLTKLAANARLRLTLILRRSTSLHSSPNARPDPALGEDGRERPPPGVEVGDADQRECREDEEEEAEGGGEEASEDGWEHGAGLGWGGWCGVRGERGGGLRERRGGGSRPKGRNGRGGRGGRGGGRAGEGSETGEVRVTKSDGEVRVELAPRVVRRRPCCGTGSGVSSPQDIECGVASCRSRDVRGGKERRLPEIKKDVERGPRKE